MGDPQWASAAWTDDFIDIQGEDFLTPRYWTRAKMMWDDTCFYIACDMEEPHLWATYNQHDMIVFHENDFEVFIDPDGDNHHYFEIEINALGTVFDLRLDKPYRDGGPAVHEWNAVGMQKAVALRGTLNNPESTDSGWSVELAIPWSCMGCKPAPGDVWRVNFSRVEWTLEVADGRYRKVDGLAEDNWVWSPQGAIDMHRPEMWGYVLFADDPNAECPFDPDHEARMTLMDLYWKQKEFHAKHGRWASILEELAWNGPRVLLSNHDSGFTAEHAGLLIREDSKLTKKPD
ncbi:MAG: carbohydrate-binding family 9-like protein [Fimbriimonadaceae bacterium]|nr:carbohydrate-binding family 9-like protein [Fimbriimonadaceae bacterium]